MLTIGVVGSFAAWSYAAGLSFAALATAFLLPGSALLAVLRSRVRRKRVEKAKEGWCAIALGAWLLISSGTGALLVERPGREGSGMFGGLIFLWPLVVGFLSCCIIAAFLPAKRITYV